MRKALALAAVFLVIAPLAGAGSEARSLRFQPIARGLDSPLHLAAPRSEANRLYVVERSGRIRVLVNGRLRAAPFLDIRRLVQSGGGEQGLLSVAFHPSYAKNRRLYVYYTDHGDDIRVAEYRANRAGSRVLANTRRQLLFVQHPYGNHNGGQLTFGPDGYLYLGTGDGGAGGDPHNYAQSLRSNLGKLLRINVDRRPIRAQIVAYGLRNPWRFSFDRANGDLYIGDVGQGAQEEIDYLPRRSDGLENFGWRVFEGTRRYTGEQPNSTGRLVGPIATYGRGDGYSVTGGFVYRGSRVPAARGRYFYGDYGSGRIWSLRVSGGRAVDERRESFTVPSLSSFGEDARGELYAVSLEGTIYRLAL